MDIPGYSLAKDFVIEIETDGRDDIEKVILVTDSFPLPELSSNVFQVVWGPGHPPIPYAGNPTLMNEIPLEMSHFYEEELIQFLVGWYEDCLDDCVANMRSGFVIGYNDEKEVVYKARLLDVWLSRLSLGTKSRDINRQRISAALSVRDIEHIFD
jgi:hypothetical protein